MTKAISRRLAVISSIIGLGLTVWFLRHGQITSILWNCWPYALTLIIAMLARKPAFLLYGIFPLLVVDMWLMSETLFGLKSPLLMMISLLATLKGIILLPIGLIWGLFMSKRSPDDNP